MAREPHSDPDDDRFGDRALAAGVGAFLTALVPVIGE